MVWSQITGKPHDCSGPCCCGVFVSVSCGRWTHRQQSGVLQAERAVELHRPRARPLTLCLLRMKREDFITSCRPRLHPSCLPPPKPHFPSYPLLLPSLPPCFPSTLPASSMFQGLSQPKEGKQTAKENLPSHGWPVLCGAQGETRRKMKGQSDGIYGLSPLNDMSVLRVYIEDRPFYWS